MTWSTWERRFGWVYAEQPLEYRELPANINPHLVWSLVDGDNGNSYVIPGFHVVNMLGYYLTQRPWVEGTADEDIFVKW